MPTAHAAAVTGHKPSDFRNDELHPPQQFRTMINRGVFTAIVRGWQCKALRCDEQDRLPERGTIRE
jgi:hypothetical protein